MQRPSFPHENNYPFQPGCKGDAETGNAAAEAVKSKAEIQRKKIQAWFLAGNVGSGEACGNALGIPMTSARSRCSELAGQGVLEDSGMRDDRTASGKPAMIWRLKP